MQLKQRRKSAKKHKYNRPKPQKRKVVPKRSKCEEPEPKKTKKVIIQREMDKSEVIETLSIFFYNAIQKNEKSKPRRNVGGTTTALCIAPSIFNSHDVLRVTPPTVEEIKLFISSIFDRRRLAAETGVFALVLLMRTSIKMNSSNWMRLILVSLLLANKEAEDVYSVWNVRFVGLIPNLPVYEINLLEMEFLQYLKYRLHVERPTYEKYYKQLVALIPEKPEITENPDPEESETLISSESENSLPRLDDTDVNPLDEDVDVNEIQPNFDDSEEEEFGNSEKNPAYYGTPVPAYPAKPRNSAAVIVLRPPPGRISEKISRVESIP